MVIVHMPHVLPQVVWGGMGLPLFTCANTVSVTKQCAKVPMCGRSLTAAQDSKTDAEIEPKIDWLDAGL